MHIKVDGRHVEVTDSMNDYIQTKLGRIERHFDHLVNVHVVLAVEKQRQMAEATIHVAGTTFMPIARMTICTPPSTR